MSKLIPWEAEEGWNSIKTHPICFASKADFEVWRTHARIAPPAPYAGFCEDCTPEYQNRMWQEDRCAHEEITFEAIGGGCVGIDRRDWRRRTAEEMARAKA